MGEIFGLVIWRGYLVDAIKSNKRDNPSVSGNLQAGETNLAA